MARQYLEAGDDIRLAINKVADIEMAVVRREDGTVEFALESPAEHHVVLVVPRDESGIVCDEYPVRWDGTAPYVEIEE